VPRKETLKKRIFPRYYIDIIFSRRGLVFSSFPIATKSQMIL